MEEVEEQIAVLSSATTQSSNTKKRRKKTFLKSPFSRALFVSLFLVTGSSIIFSLCTQKAKLSAEKGFKGQDEVDLTNGMMGYSSEDYFVSLKGTLSECPAKRMVTAPEQCLQAAISLGVESDDDAGDIIVGDWDITPRGCFLNGGVLHFSTRAAGEELDMENTAWTDFSVICSTKDIGLNGPIEDTGLHHPAEEADSKDPTTDTQLNTSSSPNYPESNDVIADTEHNPIDIFLYTDDKLGGGNTNINVTEDTTVDLNMYKDYTYPSDPSRDDDKDCMFLDSQLYRSVYVYPTWMNETDGWDGPILSSTYKNVSKWPWIDLEQEAKDGKYGHYGAANNQMGQYTLELIVRDLMTHPESCLRTMDPLKASLFYVPYLPSIEFHKGKTYAQDYSTSPYGAAIEDATEGKYDKWEEMFGLTSDFWKRKSGADHILVFSEPLHGLSHPRSRRGSHHFIYTQKMLTPPIIISIEVSTAFVKKYPKCSAKNIVTPYPNPDGNWFNGEFDEYAFETWELMSKKTAYLQAEKEKLNISRPEAKSDIFQARPFAQYYSAGAHGECARLRNSLFHDYHCTESSKTLDKKTPYHLGMRLATFCPCPGGDSPSAKRMFDAVNGGCIPIILSKDFVWPFTNEADPSIDIDPSLFSLRWNSSDFEEISYDDSCKLIDESKPSVQVAMEKISAEEIARLRRGTKHASDLYSFWSKEGYGGSEFPLLDNLFPNGGASRAIVKLLGQRAGGSKWADCKAELEGRVEGQDAHKFEC